MDKVLELVIFELREGVDRDGFLAASEGVSAWAREQPGFVSRELTYDAGGDRWVDVVWWRTMDDARAAAERALGSEACAPMFGAIEERSITMLHAEPVAQA